MGSQHDFSSASERGAQAARLTPKPRQRQSAHGIKEEKLNRVRIIQEAINATGKNDYLEIGVESGKTIKALDCKVRIGVDPLFQFDVKEASKNGMDLFEITSDEYFKNYSKEIDGVIYVDGLHTYEQSLKDIENSISIMSDQSIILVDDCLPGTSWQATPAKSHAEVGYSSWCGDVWKSIVYLRMTRDDLHIFTLDHDCGLAVITKSKPEKTLKLNGANLDLLEYGYLKNYSNILLNIKSKDYYLEFLEGRKKRFES